MVNVLNLGTYLSSNTVHRSFCSISVATACNLLVYSIQGSSVVDSNIPSFHLYNVFSLHLSSKKEAN